MLSSVRGNDEDDGPERLRRTRRHPTKQLTKHMAQPARWFYTARRELMAICRALRHQGDRFAGRERAAEHDAVMMTLGEIVWTGEMSGG